MENKLKIDRVETGPIQFEDDWPGVFIRGDNAAHFSIHLKHILEEYKKTNQYNMMDITRVEDLINVLGSCLFNKLNGKESTTETRVVKRNK